MSPRLITQSIKCQEIMKRTMHCIIVLNMCVGCCRFKQRKAKKTVQHVVHASTFRRRQWMTGTRRRCQNKPVRWQSVAPLRNDGRPHADMRGQIKTQERVAAKRVQRCRAGQLHTGGDTNIMARSQRGGQRRCNSMPASDYLLSEHSYAWNTLTSQ